MAQIILNCRYIKGGEANSKLRENLVDYMGTRDGVELNFDDEVGNEPATEKQRELILKLIAELPDVEGLFEYEDFLESPTKSTASKLISAAFDYNMDLITGKSNLVEYMGKRPHVEKAGEHGLFSVDNTDVDINAIMKEVSEHKGNVWTSVLSLRRDDAERLNFNNQQSWKDLLISQRANLSQNIGIPIDKLNIYAAFHNESHHPHCHFIMYSKEPTGGFLNKEGIQEIKSGFAKEVFHNDMYEIYNKKTLRRDELKKVSEEKMKFLIEQIQNGSADNPHLEKMLIALSEKLKTAKGKKVYGYLPKDIKADINAIVDELAKDPRITELYKSWYDMQTAIIKIYKDDVPPIKPISQCEDFKRIKNIVIEEALKIDFLNDEEVYVFSDDDITTQEIKPIIDADKNKLPYTESAKVKPKNKMDFLNKMADKDDARAHYLLGKAYFTCGEVRKDIPKAVKLLEQSAEQENQYAQYLLGKAYFFGIEVNEDKEKAIAYLTKSAQQGNEYATRVLNYKPHGNNVFRLLNHLGKLIFDEMENRKYFAKTDKKLMRKIVEKKEAQGQRIT